LGAGPSSRRGIFSIYDGLLRGELADVVDDYLRLDPDDAEVREARDGLRRRHHGDGR